MKFLLQEKIEAVFDIIKKLKEKKSTKYVPSNYQIILSHRDEPSSLNYNWYQRFV
jgi:hypothetical protein